MAFLKGLLIAALLFLSPVASNTITYNWQWTMMTDPDDIAQPMSFPAFDPSLGTLTDVIVTIRCQSGSDLRGESYGFTTVVARGQSKFLGEVALTTNPNYNSANRVNEIAYASQRYNRDEPRVLSPFDGIDDFGGTSGYMWPITWKSSRYYTYHVDPSLWDDLTDPSGSIGIYVWRNDPGLVHKVLGCGHQML